MRTRKINNLVVGTIILAWKKQYKFIWCMIFDFMIVIVMCFFKPSNLALEQLSRQPNLINLIFNSHLNTGSFWMNKKKMSTRLQPKERWDELGIHSLFHICRFPVFVSRCDSQLCILKNYSNNNWQVHAWGPIVYFSRAGMIKNHNKVGLLATFF